jgi:hypothetical protein
MKRSSIFGTKLTPFAMAALLIVVPSISHSEWALDELTYNDWCPPAVLRSALCASGEDFPTTDYPMRSRELGSFITQQIIFENG